MLSSRVLVTAKRIEENFNTRAENSVYLKNSKTVCIIQVKPWLLV